MPRPPQPPRLGAPPPTGCTASAGTDGPLVALGVFAVLGPGLLAGLSDDDPAGITTYSILGADYGYRLLWVLALSTVALIVFHELAARTGVVTGKGLMRLVRERYGAGARSRRAGRAGRREHRHDLRRVRRRRRRRGAARRHEPLRARCRSPPRPSACWCCAAASTASSTCCSRSASSSSPTSSSGFLAHPDWGAAARGLVVPAACRDARDGGPRLGRHRRHDARAVGPRVHPVLRGRQAAARRRPALRARRRGQRRGADRRHRLLRRRRLRRDAARRRAARSTTRGDAARALEPLAGTSASTLFGLGLVGAGAPGRGDRAAVDGLLGVRGVRAPRGPRPAPPRRRRSSTARTSWSWRSRRRSCWSPACRWCRSSSSPRRSTRCCCWRSCRSCARSARDPDVMGEHHLTRSGVVICVVFVVAIAIACAVLLAVTLGIG